MFEKIHPDYTKKSVYDINFHVLYKKGVRGIIFDIDNTLVHHGAPATYEAIQLFEKLKLIGFKTMLMSNNKEQRVKEFAIEVNSPYIYNAAKPISKNYYKAMKEMGSSCETTIFIGDQLFTDIWGAKRVGIPACFVKSLNPKEEFQIVLKRYLEKIVLHSYYKKKREQIR